MRYHNNGIIACKISAPNQILYGITHARHLLEIMNRSTCQRTICATFI